jgi:hypothetical protein
VNFRADPAVVQKLLPSGMRPKLFRGQAIVGICLIRLEEVRLKGLPVAAGLSSENAAHRIAVEWNDGADREGVYIPRRDTDSCLNALAGGRIFPGEHHLSRFAVSDTAGRIQFSLTGEDVRIDLEARETDRLPSTSLFTSVAETSHFFEGGCVGYSVTCDPARLDGIRLDTRTWHVEPLQVDQVFSSWFSDPARFPEGSILFDHALIMRDILHEWHAVEDYRDM